jgi:sterol desaturase/sphingolipid hydroxylase (fatty acid hydroxylase superfamily)
VIVSRYLILTGYKIIILHRWGKKLTAFVILLMFSKEEQDFIKYWEENRIKQKKFFRQIAIGLPFGVLFAVAMFVNFASGWDKRVATITKTYPSFKSLILVLIIAVLAIVVFISVFSVKVKWEKHEQRYRELLSRSQSEPKS